MEGPAFPGVREVWRLRDPGPGRSPTICASQLALCAAIALASVSARALPLPNPIDVDDEPTLDLGDPSLLKLSQGLGDYSVSLSGRAPGFANRAGDVLELEASVRFDAPSPTGTWLLVLTSVRIGTLPAAPLGCPIDGLPFASVGYELSSFGGDLAAPVAFVSDGSPGRVCDSEGPEGGPEVYLGLLFSGDAGQSFDVGFQVTLTGPLAGSPADLQFLNQAYLLTPEPRTAALLGLGLVALFALRRGSRRP